MNSMKSIELFAGAGGLALGVERAGFDHIGLIEFDKLPCFYFDNRIIYDIQ